MGCDGLCLTLGNFSLLLFMVLAAFVSAPVLLLNVGLACYLLYLIPNAAMMRLRKIPMKMFWVKKRNTNSMG